jgi:Na+/H+ antiporter NhaC
MIILEIAGLVSVLFAIAYVAFRVYNALATTDAKLAMTDETQRELKVNLIQVICGIVIFVLYLSCKPPDLPFWPCMVIAIVAGIVIDFLFGQKKAETIE